MTAYRCGVHDPGDPLCLYTTSITLRQIPRPGEHPVSVLLQLLRDLAIGVITAAVTAFFVWLALVLWLAR